MDLRECYEELGGSYAEAVGRMLSDSLIRKFLHRFPEDGTFETLKRGFYAHNDAEAFEAAHTLKGVTLNLGLGDLARSSSALTEALRGGRKEGAEKAMQDVERDYAAAVAVIGRLDT